MKHRRCQPWWTLMDFWIFRQDKLWDRVSIVMVWSCYCTPAIGKHVCYALQSAQQVQHWAFLTSDWLLQDCAYSVILAAKPTGSVALTCKYIFLTLDAHVLGLDEPGVALWMWIFVEKVLMFQETMSAMADDEEPIPAHDGPSESEGLGMPPVRGKRRPSLRGSASNVRSPPASQANNHGTSLHNSLCIVLYWQQEEGFSCIQTVGAHMHRK